jgi:hypothetical protein
MNTAEKHPLETSVRRVNTSGYEEPSRLLRSWWAVKRFLREDVPGGRPVHDAWIRFRDFTWCRWTTIKPRTVGHEFHNYGDLIAPLAFECLCRYMEDDGGNETELGSFDYADPDDDPVAELRDHYHWWTTVYQKAENDLWKIEVATPKSATAIFDEDDPLTAPYRAALEKCRKDEEALHAELIRRTHRLIELSGFMWS